MMMMSKVWSDFKRRLVLQRRRRGPIHQILFGFFSDKVATSISGVFLHTTTTGHQARQVSPYLGFVHIHGGRVEFKGGGGLKFPGGRGGGQNPVFCSFVINQKFMEGPNPGPHPHPHGHGHAWSWYFQLTHRGIIKKSQGKKKISVGSQKSTQKQSSEHNTKYLFKKIVLWPSRDLCNNNTAT